MRIFLTSIFALCLICSTSRADIVIASQDFENNTTTLGIASGNQATANAAFGVTTAGTVFDGTGLGWAVAASALDIPIVSATDDDTIGVINSSQISAAFVDPVSLIGAANTTGNFFLAEDSDGPITLTFNPIIGAGFTNLSLAFDYAISDTAFEAADLFDVSVNGTSVFALSGDSLEGISATDAFATATIDLSAFDNQTLNIAVTFNSNAGNEEFGFDNLVVSGVTVPEPSSALLVVLGLAGCALRRIR